MRAVADVFKTALSYCRPRSVAVLGVAGGNGLEQIDSAITERIVGVDINQRYLDEVRHRFDTPSGLELYCCDLAERELELAPVELRTRGVDFRTCRHRPRVRECPFARCAGRPAFRGAAAAKQGRAEHCSDPIYVDAELEALLYFDRYY